MIPYKMEQKIPQSRIDELRSYSTQKRRLTIHSKTIFHLLTDEIDEKAMITFCNQSEAFVAKGHCKMLAPTKLTFQKFVIITDDSD